MLEQRGIGDQVVNGSRTQQDSVSYLPDSTQLDKGAHLIHDMASRVDAEAFKGLVSFWLTKGTNLVLGGFLTEACVSNVTDTLGSLPDDLVSRNQLARSFFKNSSRRHVFSRTTTLASYVEDVSQTNIRWEALIIALVALGRASIDVPHYPGLYTTQAEQDVFQKLVTSLSDSCLELALSCDRMDELLLICQYENWILHSVIDGDQSELTFGSL